MTRDEWAKRRMAERKIAAEAWCQGWFDAVEDSPGRARYDIHASNVREAFALDEPDVTPDLPADDLTPYLETAGRAEETCEAIVDSGDNAIHVAKTNEEWADAVIARARALRDAARKER